MLLIAPRDRDTLKFDPLAVTGVLPRFNLSFLALGDLNGIPAVAPRDSDIPTPRSIAPHH